ncbi:MAG: tetratricopeptide repeat protein, partial [Brevinematia bacterium]
KFKEALEIFLELYKSNPKSQEYAYYVGITYANLGNYDIALNYLLFATKDNSNYYKFINANMVCGYIYTIKGEYKLAENCFRDVLKINPNSVSALVALSYVFQKTKRYDQSLIYLKKAFEIDPDNPRVLNAIAYVYAELGINLSEALRYARKAVATKDEPEFRDTLAWVYYKRGNYVEAYEEIKKAIQKLPNDPEVLEHYKEIRRKLNID